MPQYRPTEQYWFASQSQNLHQDMRNPIYGLPLSSAVIASNQHDYPPDYRASHAYNNTRPALRYSQDSRVAEMATQDLAHHAYLYEIPHTYRESMEAPVNPRVVHHVVHHVQVPPNNAHSRQLLPIPPVRQVLPAPRLARDPIDRAFSKALNAIGDNGRKITGHRIREQPPPPLERKRRRLNPLSRAGSPVDHEIIEIEDSIDERQSGTQSTRSSVTSKIARTTPPTPSPQPMSPAQNDKPPLSSVGGLSAVDTIEENVRSAIARKPVAVTGMPEPTLLLPIKDSTEVTSNVSGLNTGHSPELESDNTILQLQADVEVLLQILKDPCKVVDQIEYQRIVHELHTRARRDAYREIAHRSMMNAENARLDSTKKTAVAQSLD